MRRTPDRTATVPPWAGLGLAAVVALAGPLAAQSSPGIELAPLAGTVHWIDGAVDLVGVSAGPDGVLLVDAGYPETEAAVRAAIETLGAGPPVLLVTTHWHHAFANAGFADAATIVGHRSLRDRLSRPNRMAGRDVPAFDDAALPNVVFDDSLTLHFNGDTISLLHLPAAHTDGDVAVLFRDAGVAFTGDVFVPHVPWIDVEAGGSIRGLMGAIDRLMDWIPPEAVIVPGHDHPVDRERLVAFRDMLAGTTAWIESRLAEGATPDELAAEGLPDRWAAWRGAVPDSLYIWSVVASLEREAHAEAGSSAGSTCRYANGRVFDGRRFVARDLFVDAGRLVAAPAEPPGCTVELTGGWVVPPYGDAHRHDLADPARLDEQLAVYVERGVLYAMEQDPIDVVGPAVRDRLMGPGTVDVAYTQGVVTPSWGFIAGFYEGLLAEGRFGDRTTLAEIDGREITIVDDRADLDRQWPGLVRRNDAFLKVILAFSEDFDRRRTAAFAAAAPGPAATAGFDPEVLPDLVRRAHEAGLRVSAHIETAADFRVAVDAGVDVIAHLPAAWQIGAPTGYPDGELDPWLLTANDARRAAGAGTIVVTTIHRVDEMPRRDDFVRVHRHNLGLLAEHGVAVAIGADGFEPEVLGPGEATFLRTLGIYDDRALLEMLAMTTPRAIFPDRPVGCLEPGCEASFLVLDGDPLAEWGAVRRIRLRVKDGIVLDEIGPAPAARLLDDR